MKRLSFSIAMILAVISAVGQNNTSAWGGTSNMHGISNYKGKPVPLSRRAGQ